MAPVLITDRLRLDGLRADDWTPLAAMWQQPEVYRFIADRRPRPAGEVWRALCGAVGQWDLFGFGGFAVRDRAGDTLLGTVGLMEARRALVPPLDAPEASWMLGRDAQGCGLAREALDALFGWADAAGFARTQCIIDPDNARSVALAEALGYRRIGSRARRDAGDAVLMFERVGGAA